MVAPHMSASGPKRTSELRFLLSDECSERTIRWSPQGAAIPPMVAGRHHVIRPGRRPHDAFGGRSRELSTGVALTGFFGACGPVSVYRL